MVCFEACSDHGVTPPLVVYEELMPMAGYGADQTVESQADYSVYTIYTFSFFVHVHIEE